MEFNNSSSNVSTQFYVTDPTHGMQLWIYGFLVPLVAVPGIFANFASIIVFCQRNMRSSINTYLAGLACSDFLLLLLVMLIYPPMAYCLHLEMPTMCSILNYSILICYPVTLVAHFCSVWTCVALTVDRFMAVKYPLQKRIYCRVRRSVRVLLIIACVGVLYCVPSLFEVRLDSSGIPRPTEFRNSKLYTLIYKANCNLVILVIVPWIIMIIFNATVILSIKSASRNREKMSLIPDRLRNRNGGDSEGRSTKMAFLVIILFLICNLPAGINGYLQETAILNHPHSTPYAWCYVFRRLMVFLGNWLVCLNSSTNFLIYCILGPRFRQRFMEIFFRKPPLPDRKRSSVPSMLAYESVVRRRLLGKERGLFESLDSSLSSDSTTEQRKRKVTYV